MKIPVPLALRIVKFGVLASIASLVFTQTHVLLVQQQINHEQLRINHDQNEINRSYRERLNKLEGDTRLTPPANPCVAVSLKGKI